MTVRKRPRVSLEEETISQRPRVDTSTTSDVTLRTILEIPLIRDDILGRMSYYDRILAVYCLVQAGCLSKPEAKEIYGMWGMTTKPLLPQEPRDAWGTRARSILSELHVTCLISDPDEILEERLRPYEKSLEYMPPECITTIQSMFKNMENRRRVEEVIGPVDYSISRSKYVERHNVLGVMLNDPDKRCSKARCHELFLVSDKDLKDLECTYERNIYHRSKYPMHMYALLEVAKVAMEKYGSWAGLKAEMKKRDKRAVIRHQKLEEKHAQNRIARREELIPLLRERGLEDYVDECSHYLNLAHKNDEKAADAVRELDHWRFFSLETSGYSDWDVEDWSPRLALYLWVERHKWDGTLEDDLKSFIFPPTLMNMAREFESKLKQQEVEREIRNWERAQAGEPLEHYDPYNTARNMFPYRGYRPIPAWPPGTDYDSGEGSEW